MERYINLTPTDDYARSTPGAGGAHKQYAPTVSPMIWCLGTANQFPERHPRHAYASLCCNANSAKRVWLPVCITYAMIAPTG